MTISHQKKDVSKETGIIKKNQKKKILELRSIITKMNNLLVEIHSRFELAKERISNLRKD